LSVIDRIAAAAPAETNGTKSSIEQIIIFVCVTGLQAGIDPAGNTLMAPGE
jgi:hypothetical protein